MELQECNKDEEGGRLAMERLPSAFPRTQLARKQTKQRLSGTCVTPVQLATDLFGAATVGAIVLILVNI